MDGRIELSVVIPAFNEEHKIAGDLARAAGFLDRQPYPYEIIVVDDGSADRTAEVAGGISKENPRIRVIRLPENLGKGAAVRTGMQAARGACALFADAGTCVPYDHVERGLTLISGGADLAFGSRVIVRSRILKSSPLHRRMGSMGFQMIVEHIMGLKNIADTQCGFKMYTRRAYRDIFHNLITDGFMFDVETLLYAQLRKYDIRFFPVDWSNDPDTRFKPVSGSVRNFKELIRILLRIRKVRQGRVEIQVPTDPPEHPDP